MTPLVLVAAGFGVAAIGTTAGIGGAVILVPLIVLGGGLAPVDAAPLGLLAVLGGSVAAGARHIDDGLVNHRIGVVVELAAAVGAAAGALLVTSVRGSVAEMFLGAAAIAGAVVSARGPVSDTTFPQAVVAGETPGEWPTSLAGVWMAPHGAVAYQARRMGLTTTAMVIAGLVAGASGSSGGFIKTPVLTRISGLPTRVAAATTTFTVGITAAVALVVFAAQGHLDDRLGAAVVAGSIPGGLVGAVLQNRWPVARLRVVLSLVLVVVGMLLIVA